jgi:hypothetical protein
MIQLHISAFTHRFVSIQAAFDTVKECLEIFLIVGISEREQFPRMHRTGTGLKLSWLRNSHKENIPPWRPRWQSENLSSLVSDALFLQRETKISNRQTEFSPLITKQNENKMKGTQTNRSFPKCASIHQILHQSLKRSKNCSKHRYIYNISLELT